MTEDVSRAEKTGWFVLLHAAQAQSSINHYRIYHHELSFGADDPLDEECIATIR